MRVLAIEDDPDTSAMLKLMLGRDGHIVEVAATSDDGLWMATEFEFDVVVLDWTLPGDHDGPSICEELRNRDRWMPILMLTGHTAIDERVTGLQAGADDYLTKPFAMEELSARLHVLLRRAPQERPAVLEAGDLVLDPAVRSVRRGDTAIALRPKEFAVLELLMRQPGTVLRREEILDRVWDMNFDGMSNVVDVHMNSLRNKIDKPFQRKSIETVWRVGYRLRAD